MIVLHAMRWPDEIHSLKELSPGVVELSEDEIEGAQALIDSMTHDSLESAEFVDHYTDALAEVIKAKRKGDAPPEATEAAAPARQIVDLMTALEASVQRTRAFRGEDGDADMHELTARKKPNTVERAINRLEQARAVATATTNAATSSSAPLPSQPS